MRLSKEDTSFWILSKQGVKAETASEAILIMKSGAAAKITPKIFQDLIEQFEEFRIYNCFKALNSIYVPYVDDNEEPYWLCVLRYVPNEIYENILNLK